MRATWRLANKQRAICVETDTAKIIQAAPESVRAYLGRPLSELARHLACEGAVDVMLVHANKATNV